MSTGSWVRFIRNYGPIPTNDNMYDETIQRALKRHKITPLTLPAPLLANLLSNFSSDKPRSQILTGLQATAKHIIVARFGEPSAALKTRWNAGTKVQRFQTPDFQLIIVKDLSELGDYESGPLLQQMAADIADSVSSRVYLIAANHGQLLEKLKSASDTLPMQALSSAVEELLVTGVNPDPNMSLDLSDLSGHPRPSLSAMSSTRLRIMRGGMTAGVAGLELDKVVRSERTVSGSPGQTSRIFSVVV